jgi:hypothetical protein
MRVAVPPTIQATEPPPRRTREAWVDVFKGLLALGMIYVHVVCILGVQDYSPARAASVIPAVACFPGFLFCFGYAAEIAYFSRGFARSWRRLVANGIRMLLAFYISAIAFRLLAPGPTLSAGDLWRILALLDIPSYSEFLVAFALYMFLAAALFRPINWLLDRPYPFWLAMALLLVTTYIPYASIPSTHLGLLIGTTRTPTFPVVQFAPFFLIGAFLRRHAMGVGVRVLVISAACSSVLVIVSAMTRVAPETYPPRLSWVLGSALLLCLYYWASQALARRPGLITGVLELLGQNVLFCLLASNLMLFALQRVWPGNLLGPAEYLPLTVVLTATIYYLLTIVRSPTRN